MADIPNRWSVDLDDTTGFAPFSACGGRTVRTVGIHYDHFGVGGAERVAAELVRIILGLGHRVVLYTNDAPGGCGQALPPDVERKAVPSSEGDEEARCRFWEGEVGGGLDCVVYNSWVSAWVQFDCWALKRCGAAFVLHTHSVFTSWFDDEIADYLARALPWTASRSDAVICLNEETAEVFSAYSSRALLVPNPIESYLRGVDTTPVAHAGKRIAWVGRISDEKRPYEALRIFSRVLGGCPNARLTMVGGPSAGQRDEPEAIRSYASDELGLMGGHVTFTGPLPDPYRVLRESDLYLLTSSYEGFPLSLAEAMRFGLPVVSYDMPYLELLKRNRGVSVVAVGDVEGAAAEVSSLLRDDERRRAMGDCARIRYDEVCNIDFPKLWRGILCAVGTGDLAGIEGRRVRGGGPGRNVEDIALGRIGEMCSARRYRRGVDEAKAVRLEEEVARLEGEVTSLARENERLMGENDRLGDEIQGIRASRAYRFGSKVAAPYRAIVEAVRGRRT